MRSDKRSQLMWTITVVALLGFVEPIGAIPLESWDDKIPSAGTRFKVLSEFNGQAVLDKETQLVWELSPGTTSHNWSDARVQCTSRTIGGRKGWRLPSVHELASLVDPAVTPSGPTLLPGHPFLNVQPIVYWSATTNAEDPTVAWDVRLNNGDVGTSGKIVGKVLVWCVRGGMNADQY